MEHVRTIALVLGLLLATICANFVLVSLFSTVTFIAYQYFSLVMNLLLSEIKKKLFYSINANQLDQNYEILTENTHPILQNAVAV